MNVQTLRDTNEKIKISVVMTVAGDIEITKRALKSIDDNSCLPFELILVDGVHHLEEIKFINPFIRRIKIVNLGELVGYVKAMNAGIKEASGEYIVVCQNDIELVYNELDWLIMMSRLMDTHPEFGAVGPVTSTRHSKLVLSSGQLAEPDDFIFGFQCVMLRRRAIEDIGYIDENFIGNGGFDDDDFFLRMKMRWKLGLVMIGITHHYNESFARSQDNSKSVKNAIKNYNYFNSKWAHLKIKRGDKIENNDNTPCP